MSEGTSGTAPTAYELVRLHLDGVATGDVGMARRCLHPDEVNVMAVDEPPACARHGVPGFMATSAWLRLAFPNLAFEIIEVVESPERVVAHVWMRGRQTGPFVVFPPGEKPVAFPPTGREFAVQHFHAFRMRDGLHGEHLAVRDDLGMLTQLGHLPPSPAVALRMARWNLSGAAKRAITDAIRVSDEAAAAVT